MKTALIIGLLALVPVLLGLGFTASGLLGALFEALYNNDINSWGKEGKPTTFTWSPPDAEFNQGNFSGMILSFKLLFNTPAWITVVPDGEMVLKRLRVLSALNFATIVAIFFLFQLLLGYFPSA